MSEITRPRRCLKDRVAIVTGAGAAGDGIGNGRAAAILLALDGANVVCVDINHDLAERTAEMIEKETGSSHRSLAQGADVTKEHQIADVIQNTLDLWGRIDILVNSVGINGPKGTAVDVDMAAFAKAMEINVTSMVLMAKYCIPEMVKNTDNGMWKGAIVNLGSVAGLMGGTPNVMYPTSKGAIVNMTRAMAANHARDGIRVNCVCPGMVYTPMMQNHYEGGMSSEVREQRRERSLLKTEGNGWDVGSAVRFLASDEARWMTGVILPVDAGATAAVMPIGF
jgi:NAD(P)-dependent dehydrogenase (short-subunit alcohol dehydrogenase family)